MIPLLDWRLWQRHVFCHFVLQWLKQGDNLFCSPQSSPCEAYSRLLCWRSHEARCRTCCDLQLEHFPLIVVPLHNTRNAVLVFRVRLRQVAIEHVDHCRAEWTTLQALSGYLRQARWRVCGWLGSGLHWSPWLRRCGLSNFWDHPVKRGLLNRKLLSFHQVFSQPCYSCVTQGASTTARPQSSAVLNIRWVTKHVVLSTLDCFIR